jgi:hypothetical protein
MKATIAMSVGFLMIFINPAQAQVMFFKNELGAGIGTFVYQGDLTPERMGSYKTMKPAVNIYFNKVLNTMFLLRTNLAIGGLKADDGKYSTPEYRKQRNFSFKTPVIELSEIVEADIFKNNQSKLPGLSPYVFIGAGFTLLNIKRDYSGFNGEYFASEQTTLDGLMDDEQVSPPHILPVLPLGIGIRYALTKNILISIETSYRYAFTDYLDGFSKAANASKYDSYQSNTIGITYRFLTNDVVKCPVF